MVESNDNITFLSFRWLTKRRLFIVILIALCTVNLRMCSGLSLGYPAMYAVLERSIEQVNIVNMILNLIIMLSVLYAFAKIESLSFYRKKSEYFKWGLTVGIIYALLNSAVITLVHILDIKGYSGSWGIVLFIIISPVISLELKIIPYLEKIRGLPSDDIAYRVSLTLAFIFVVCITMLIIRVANLLRSRMKFR